MDDVAVIVVNWNTLVDLKACLDSLFCEPLPKLAYRVWVVDNASSDGSAQMVRKHFPQVNLIVNDTNVGFSKANNQAIAASDSRYLFLLNSDASIFPCAIDNLTAFADDHPEAGILGAKVLNPDGSLQFSCRRFPTLGAGVFRNTYLGRLFPHNKYAHSYLMTEFDHKSVLKVDWVSGCAMFIRRSVLDKIGVLDERFFMYCEDVDICERVWQAGSEVVYMPSAIVTHAIGHSSDKAFEKMNTAFHRALFELDKKRHPGFHPLRRPAVWTGLWLRASVRLWKHRAALTKRKKLDEVRK